MRLPGRYRIAMLAYPAGYRADRGPELAATLAEGDDDRGRPSTHEAASLAYRGLLLRLRAGGTPDGLLTAAAIVVLIACFGGFTWAERLYVFRGEFGAIGTDGAGRWWGFALALTAFVIVMARSLRVVERGQWVRRTLLTAGLFALLSIAGPGELVRWALSDPMSLPEFFEWRGRILLDWRHTAELLAAALIGVVLARLLLVRRTDAARAWLLSTALIALSVITVAQTWTRPEIEPVPRSFTVGYAQSAFADLEAGAFIAMAGLALGVAAWIRRRGWDSNPRGT